MTDEGKRESRNLLIDTHCHLDMSEFIDLDEVICNAKKSGIEKIVIPSVDRESFERVIEISAQYDCVYCALGIHPTEAQNAKDEDFDKILRLACAPDVMLNSFQHPISERPCATEEGSVRSNCVQNKKIIAIGECGLDYYWDKTFIKEQKEVFLRQIDIAKQLKKPLIVHDREAHKDCFDILTQNVKDEIPVIMHCFSGSLEFANECVKKGFYISLGGVVTFKNAKKAHEIAKNIPIENLLLETDAPYLTPVPYRGKRNEPAYVKFVAEEIAKIRGISFEEIAKTTTENARKVFGV